MAHHNYLATIQAPVTSSGCDIKNRNGETIATVNNGWMADAMAQLINWGMPTAEANEAAYERRQADIRKLLNRL